MSATSRTAQDEEARCWSCGHDGYCDCTCCTPDSVASGDDSFAADYHAAAIRELERDPAIKAAHAEIRRALAEETFARIDASTRSW